ncbi:spermatogenesis-associated protein 6 [Syngnathus scovelli]|uniref:spermatogenesis-associated protein 6 n=1 Tax=Syngnathus scovelli TaxID=161590 RepID=UPI002110145F|nr:spermatogenesis-associated protein 6 isoform X1 [Syngnathus scovelli]
MAMTLSSKLHKKSWKCTVSLDIHKVTCRGMRLPKTGDIHLSVCIMGQCKKTSCLPPRFPLHFNQLLVFEKTYTDAIDPSAVADLLKADTTSFQLIQERKTLATMTQNSKDFLKHGPNLSGVKDPMQRDTLMMETSASFHGAFPTVEFSKTSFIQENDWPVEDSTATQQKEMASFAQLRPFSSLARRSPNYVGWSTCRRSPSPPPCRHISCEAKPRKHRGCQEPGYQRPTVASTTRALSPYTHRKMCQLSLDAEQRLRHFQLGPFYFKKETESLPLFLVPTCSSLPKMYSPLSHVHCCHTVSLSNDDSDSELSQNPLPTSSASPGPKRRDHGTTKRSLGERLYTREPSPSYWEQIHSRVQKILLTHRVPLDIK